MAGFVVAVTGRGVSAVDIARDVDRGAQHQGGYPVDGEHLVRVHERRRHKIIGPSQFKTTTNTRCASHTVWRCGRHGNRLARREVSPPGSSGWRVRGTRQPGTHRSRRAALAGVDAGGDFSEQQVEIGRLLQRVRPSDVNPLRQKTAGLQLPDYLNPDAREMRLVDD